MLPPPRDEPGPDSPGLRNGAKEGTQAAGSAGSIATVTLQPYRLYGWFKPLAEVPIYLANDWRILNQLADEHLGVLMEAPSDLADTVPLGYGQLTSPLDQIASVAGGRAGTNFNHIPDGTVSIR